MPRGQGQGWDSVRLWLRWILNLLNLLIPLWHFLVVWAFLRSLCNRLWKLNKKCKWNLLSRRCSLTEGSSLRGSWKIHPQVFFWITKSWILPYYHICQFMPGTFPWILQRPQHFRSWSSLVERLRSFWIFKLKHFYFWLILGYHNFHVLIYKLSIICLKNYYLLLIDSIRCLKLTCNCWH